MSFWLPVVICSVAGLSAGIFWSLTAPAGYASTGTAFVAFAFPAEEKDPFSAGQFLKQRIESYAQLGESPELLQAVADDLGGPPASELAGKTTVSAVPGTVLLRVTAQDNDRLTSLKLANSVMANLNEAVIAVETGGSPDGISPVDLIPVQPAIAGPASSIFGTLLKSTVGLGLGAVLGAALGWILSRRKPAATGSVDAPTRAAHRR